MHVKIHTNYQKFVKNYIPFGFFCKPKAKKELKFNKVRKGIVGYRYDILSIFFQINCHSAFDVVS